MGPVNYGGFSEGLQGLLVVMDSVQARARPAGGPPPVDRVGARGWHQPQHGETLGVGCSWPLSQ